MNWVEKAKYIFEMQKPEHFTDYLHCEECADHDETLRNTDVDNIGLKELGNEAWDPLCFCTNDGKKYYMPALIRLSLDSVNDEFYFDQFLFHLEGNGENNRLLLSCSEEQKTFITSFLKYMIENYSKEIDDNLCTDDAIRVYELWKRHK